MIGEAELKQAAIDLGVPLVHVEKDYVMGWLLWGISKDEFLRNKFVLKGGNCLRKIYFSETRFSDDLDFTMIAKITLEQFKGSLQRVCKLLQDKAGIPFHLDETSAEEINCASEGEIVFVGKAYFRGFAGDERLTLKIKFDISSYEKIVFPLQMHPLIHPYSDANLCMTQVACYSIEEILAEKLRSVIQRSRPRDLFDIVKIVLMDKIPLSKTNIARAFLEKTIFKSVPFGGKGELLVEEKFQIISTNWDQALVCSQLHTITFTDALRRYTEFVEVIFSRDVLEKLVPAEAFTRRYQVIKSSIREAIITAGKERKLISLTYHGVTRVVEPYSFRFRNGEAFFGFDRTRGQTIKHFKVGEIAGVSIRPETFTPRWLVEF